MRIEDIDITQESVEEFFNEIDTKALVDSIKMSIDTHECIKVNVKKTYYTPVGKELPYTLGNMNTKFGDMGVAA
ncbi:hypothetical protein HN00_09525 [Limosilactobacillus reuteri]|nr:hypothetical protein [Lactobacillus taiwanensis]KGE71300.1 hypothetical protein HN00_09525 [Limosilactobacillus reuteri]